MLPGTKIFTSSFAVLYDFEVQIEIVKIAV